MSKVNVVRDEPPAAHGESIGTLLGQVPKHLRAFVTAQLNVYKLEAARRGQSAGMAAAFFIVALLLFQAALAALAVGLIILVAQSLGTGWAILIIVGATLVLTAVCAWLGLRQVKLVTNPDAR